MSVAIDRTSSSSEQLSPEAIVHFVNSLTAVSREELSGTTKPAGVLDAEARRDVGFNTNRVRFVWARIWELLGEFFTEVGQHPNYDFAHVRCRLATPALSRVPRERRAAQLRLRARVPQALRRRPDGSALGPLEIRELILDCLDTMILSRTKNIKSGWTPMFSVFSLAAQDVAASLAQPGFKLA